jgi:hypothetical protein
VRFDHGAKRRFVLQFDKSFHRLSVSEQDERRNAPNSVLGGQLLIRVGIDFRTVVPVSTAVVSTIGSSIWHGPHQSA